MEVKNRRKTRPKWWEKRRNENKYYVSNVNDSCFKYRRVDIIKLVSDEYVVCAMEKTSYKEGRDYDYVSVRFNDLEDVKCFAFYLMSLKS